MKYGSTPTKLQGAQQQQQQQPPTNTQGVNQWVPPEQMEATLSAAERAKYLKPQTMHSFTACPPGRVLRAKNSKGGSKNTMGGPTRARGQQPRKGQVSSQDMGMGMGLSIGGQSMSIGGQSMSLGGHSMGIGGVGIGSVPIGKQKSKRNF